MVEEDSPRADLPVTRAQMLLIAASEESSRRSSGLNAMQSLPKQNDIGQRRWRGYGIEPCRRPNIPNALAC
jgi:hypothetical protein